MGLSKVSVNVGKDGLGRRAPNTDKISGLIFYSNTLPAGFAADDRVKKVYALSEAEALGIAEGSADFDVHHYHISEFFRMNPEGELWLGFFAVPAGAYDFAEIGAIMTGSQAEIRQLGIYANALAFAAAQITTIQAYKNALNEAYRNFKVVYSPNLKAITAITGWAAMADNRTLNAPDVTTVIAESGSGVGKELSDAKAYTIGAIGTALGCLSKAAVSESIGNPERFNISDGVEFEEVALANGDLISAISLATLGGLKDKGYLVARKYVPDITGSYFERVPMSVTATSDFAWIEAGRTVDKAIRLVRAKMVPRLQARVYVDKESGLLRPDTVGYFEDLAQGSLDQMEIEGDLSGGKAIVNPLQNVLATSKLSITLKLVPVGIAEEIEINIGLTLNL